MQPFQIEECEGKRSAWIYPETDGEYEAVDGEPEPGKVALKVCYFTPKDEEALFHRMIQKGVMRRKAKGTVERFDLVPGRRLERDTMFAEALVVDWRGILGPDKAPLPYSPEAMARVLAGRQDVYDTVWKAVEEIGHRPRHRRHPGYPGGHGLAASPRGTADARRVTIRLDPTWVLWKRISTP